MPKLVTVQMLQKMTPKQRMTIYEHARETNSSEADDIIEKLFQHKLLDSAGGGLTRDSGIVQRVEKICRSSDGVRAAEAAADRGEAPMAGVDQILQREVREYGHFDTTSWAGSFVAQEMEARGWIRSGRKSLPENCVARTAAFFVRKKAA
ncbi:hypothetical protein [Sphingomonas sp.]|uniref:hypothetical protein n=1 Tax=Sphingomonas sp. TaxID=28214 RepID=UPI0038A3DBAC